MRHASGACGASSRYNRRPRKRRPSAAIASLRLAARRDEWLPFQNMDVWCASDLHRSCGAPNIGGFRERQRETMRIAPEEHGLILWITEDAKSGGHYT